MAVLHTIAHHHSLVMCDASANETWQDAVPLVSDGHSSKAHLGAREMHSRLSLVRPLRVVDVKLDVH